MTLTAVAEDSGARIITQAELLAGVSDIDSPAGGRSITSVSIASGSGSLVNNGNGTWTYTPAANDDTSVTFNYTAIRRLADLRSTASLDLLPVNDAPVATPVTLTAVAEDSGARIITQAELLAGVSDIDTPAAGARSPRCRSLPAAARWSTTATAPGPTRRLPMTTPRDVQLHGIRRLADLRFDGHLDLSGQRRSDRTPVTLTAVAEDSGARIITQAELLAGVSDVDTPAGGRRSPRCRSLPAAARWSTTATAPGPTPRLPTTTPA